MAAQSAKRGFFRNAIDVLVAAREKQALRYVNGALLMMDDQTLRTNGYDRDQLRRRGGVGYLF